ncbi:hypothetical protein LEP1GSC170_2228 [Leptospira interrogans serovar Bataviae str. HAI135]|uniref:hypothetical protein n=1 Tax=Leptospira noguchii TaxID=28182 RepID=UPI0002BDBF6F|nr:hypothetical protein [Leptospira noguchii]EMI64885.1 hypothetical protein LEP1GSC072_0931 [Leptospira noguchii str. Bonito]EMO25804.1 hypothetical protein LEP1GSC170_2228 [Leptospira interrogans serovar Bataviae str. HAI135]UOG36236.1 hypothetical protein MAL02_18785 [Leptospira noguchii]UOG47199.1 hypothetical protein MAL01_19185 [Leptospira noguchii]
MITEVYFRFDLSEKVIELDVFVQLIQNELLGFDHEIRESSNYFAGFYHKFKTKENIVTVADADNVCFYNYHYVIFFNKDEKSHQDKVIKLAETWGLKGWTVSIPDGPLIDDLVKTCSLNENGEIIWKEHRAEPRKN